MFRVLELAVIGSGGMLTYIVLLRVMAPRLWNDLLSAGSPVTRRLGRIVPFLPGEDSAS